MAQFPALLLWTDAWIADTKHLTRCERGTYHDLIVLMWRTAGCSVPNDDAWLGKQMGMSPTEVANELRPLIKEFCQSDGNRLWQKRLTVEFKRALQRAHAQSVRAKARWNKEKKSTRGHATFTPQEMPPTPTPAHSKKEKKVRGPLASRSTASRSIASLARSSDDEHFREFYENYPRKVRKKAAEKAYAKAVKEASPARILDALERQKPLWKDPTFIPYPASWLNAGGWDDELPGITSTEPKPRTDAEIVEMHRKAREAVAEQERRNANGGTEARDHEPDREEVLRQGKEAHRIAAAGRPK